MSVIDEPQVTSGNGRELSGQKDRLPGRHSGSPVISEAKLPSILVFLSGFAKMVNSLSLERRRGFKATEAMQGRAEELRRSQG